MSKPFEGVVFRTASNWFQHVDVESYKNRPINYLEIGALYGANLISVSETYGLHNDSKLYCIDPWEEYKEYKEYENELPNIYNSFIKNIENFGIKNKVIINRGFSNVEIHKYPDEYFDIIYIDANHDPEYALEDGVLSFRKLKKEGIMIYDDYGWGGPDLTQRGIDAFMQGYYRRITFLGEKGSQVFIKKNY
jgi:hypothetical protein